MTIRNAKVCSAKTCLAQTCDDGTCESIIPKVCSSGLIPYFPCDEEEPVVSEVYVEVTGVTHVCAGGSEVGLYDVAIHDTADTLDSYFAQGMTVKVHDRIDRTEGDWVSYEDTEITKLSDDQYGQRRYTIADDLYCFAEDGSSIPEGSRPCVY